MTDAINSPAEASPSPADGGDRSAMEEQPRATGFQLVLPNILTMSRLVMALAFFVVLSLYRFPDRFPEALPIATVLFILAALTDAADGYLARRWNAITTFGRIFDPFADKFLVLGAFILLAGPQFMVQFFAHELGPGGPTYDPVSSNSLITGVAPWMVIAILSRELLVTTIRGACESKGIDFSATFSGKLKMIVQSIAIPIILIIAHIATTIDQNFVEHWMEMHESEITQMNNSADSSSELQYTEAVQGNWSTKGVLITINTLLAYAVVIVTIWSAIPYTARGYKGLRALDQRNQENSTATDH